MEKIHSALAPIQWLIGTWESINAKGHYPTINEFEYSEVLKFESLGQPLLNYEARSRNPLSGVPMHMETGFLRIKPGTNHVAFMISHNFGLSVIEEGTASEKGLELRSESIVRMSFAKEPPVKGLKKIYTLNEDGTLEIRTDMETSNTAMTNHLVAIYKKI